MIGDSIMIKKEDNVQFDEAPLNYVEEIESNIEEEFESAELQPVESLGESNMHFSRSIAQSDDSAAEEEELNEFFRNASADMEEADAATKDDENLKFGQEIENRIKEMDANPPEEPTEEMDEVQKKALESFSATRVLLGGVADSAQNTINFGIDVADFLDNLSGLDAIPDGYKVEAISKIIPKGQSTSENVMRGIVSFLVPFAGISKAAKGLQFASKGAMWTKAAVIGAASDLLSFDPDEKNLSGLIQDTSLRNPITEYLATGDSRLEKRIKGAFEGFLIGGVADAVMSGIKMYRNIRIFKKSVEAIKKADNIIKETVEKTPENMVKEAKYVEGVKALETDKSPENLRNAIKAMSDLEHSGVKMPKVAYTKALEPDESIKIMKELVRGGLGGNRAGNINLKKIAVPEQTRKNIKIFASFDKEAIQKARRGTLKDKVVKQMAEDLGMTYEDVLNWKEGQAMNAEQITAARNLMVRSVGEVQNVARRVMQGEALVTDFLDALDLHRELQVRISGPIAEAGRAMRALQFEALGGQGADRLKAINDIIKQHGEHNLINLVRNVAELDPSDINKLLHRSTSEKVWDAALSLRVNGLLSSPKTWMNNFLGNSLSVMSAPVETAWARQIAKMRGHGDAYEGEAIAQLKGIAAGWSDAWRLAKISMKEGKYADDQSKLAYLRENAISAEAFEATGNYGRALDVLGKTIRIPGKILVASDEFFKEINSRMKIYQLWARRSKGLKHLNLSEEQLAARFEDFKAQPDIIKQASDFSAYNTFTNPLPQGSTSSTIEKALKNHPLGRLMFPFTRTNLNLIRFSMERFPVLNRMLPEVRAAIAKGGPEADMVLAKSSLGAAITGTIGVMAYNGLVTGSGPGNKEAMKMWRASGRVPYAFKVGDKYYSFNRLDPIGSLFALGADLGQLASYAKGGDVQYEEYATAVMIAVGNFYTPEFLVEQAGTLADAVFRQDQSAIEKIMRDLPQTFIPYSSALRDIRKDVDPNVRMTYDRNKTPVHRLFDTAFNKMKNTIPWLSSDLPMMVNRLGDPVLYPIGWTPEIASPIMTSNKKPGIVYEELVSLGVASPLTKSETKLGDAKLSIPDVPTVLELPGYSPIKLSLQQQSEYVRLAAGIGLKDSDGADMPPLKKVLEEEIRKGYPTLKNDQYKITDNAKKLFIYLQFKKYLDLATNQMRQDMGIMDQSRELERIRKNILEEQPTLGE